MAEKAQNMKTYKPLIICHYPNKVVFTHKPYPELKSAFYIKGFENENEVGDLFTFSGWNGEKYYDQFDYVSWFNQK